MSQTQQNFANHARIDPAYHFFLVPVMLASVIVSMLHFRRHPDFFSFWIVVFTVAIFVAIFTIRRYALKVQDRVIRLEERLRLSALVSEEYRSRIGDLTKGQLIALRFASDAEAPSLIEKSLASHLSPKQIKQLIQNWRPDNLRI